MSESETNMEIDYDSLVQDSLKLVIKKALKKVEKNGLPGEHHFYISFDTNHPQVDIHQSLKEVYPGEMTIVLQYQFTNLVVEEDFFCVDLSFSGVKRTLKVSYDAISYFADPHAKFGLQFNVEYNKPQEEQEVEEKEDKEDKKQEQKPDAQDSDDEGNVVALDSFRKK
jgi:hypothetical protein